MEDEIECYEQGKKDAISAGTLPADLADPVCQDLIRVAADLEASGRGTFRACRRAYLEGFCAQVRSGVPTTRDKDDPRRTVWAR